MGIEVSEKRHLSSIYLYILPSYSNSRVSARMKFRDFQTRSLGRVLKGTAKGNGTKGGQNTEKDRDRLLEADGAGDGRAAQDNRGKQTQLNAVWLAVLDAIATEAVCVFLDKRVST